MEKITLEQYNTMSNDEAAKLSPDEIKRLEALDDEEDKKIFGDRVTFGSEKGKLSLGILGGKIPTN